MARSPRGRRMAARAGLLAAALALSGCVAGIVSARTPERLPAERLPPLAQRVSFDVCVSPFRAPVEREQERRATADRIAGALARAGVQAELVSTPGTPAQFTVTERKTTDEYRWSRWLSFFTWSAIPGYMDERWTLAVDVASSDAAQPAGRERLRYERQLRTFIWFPLVVHPDDFAFFGASWSSARARDAGFEATAARLADDLRERLGRAAPDAWSEPPAVVCPRWFGPQGRRPPAGSRRRRTGPARPARRAPRLAASAAISLALATGAAGCAWMRDAPLEPAARERLAAGPPIHVVHYVPMPLHYARSALDREDVFYDVPGTDDPVVELERAFLAGVRERMGLSNVVAAGGPLWLDYKMIPRGVPWERACAYGDPMTGLPAEWFPDGLVLEFETLTWGLDGSGFKRIVGKCTFAYGVRARLVRLADDTVLWRRYCLFQRGGQCTDFTADDLRLVRELRAEAARRCAAELVGAFTGDASAAR